MIEKPARVSQFEEKISRKQQNLTRSSYKCCKTNKLIVKLQLFPSSISLFRGKSETSHQTWRADKSMNTQKCCAARKKNTLGIDYETITLIATFYFVLFLFRRSVIPLRVEYFDFLDDPVCDRLVVGWNHPSRHQVEWASWINKQPEWKAARPIKFFLSSFNSEISLTVNIQ